VSTDAFEGKNKKYAVHALKTPLKEKTGETECKNDQRNRNTNGRRVGFKRTGQVSKAAGDIPGRGLRKAGDFRSPVGRKKHTGICTVSMDSIPYGSVF
jgi:hypothetical protein